MASSTVGASTFIVWKRRSSAASFSMYLRYSFIVVAPTHCNSPRLSAGLMMFAASVAQQFGHVAVCNLLSQSFGNGRLADACFADQDWIVLGPPAKHLNYALDFIAPANYGIEFSLPRQFSQVTAECAKRWSFDVLLRRFATFLLRFRRREVWIELFKNLVASAFDIEFEALEHSGGNPLALAQKSKQNMFRADVRMIERLGFLAC